MNYVEFFLLNFIDRKFDKIFHTCCDRLIVVSKSVVSGRLRWELVKVCKLNSYYYSFFF